MLPWALSIKGVIIKKSPKIKLARSMVFFCMFILLFLFCTVVWRFFVDLDFDLLLGVSNQIKINFQISDVSVPFSL